jgi:hypothetical protein
MKRSLLLLAAVMTLCLSFLAGAAACLFYTARPMMQMFTDKQTEVFPAQVYALKRLKEGSPVEAERYLRGMNVASLTLLTADELQTRKSRASPSIHDAAAYACSDALGDAHEKGSADLREACKALGMPPTAKP